MESPKALPSFTANPADTLNTSLSCGVVFYDGGAGRAWLWAAAPLTDYACG
jgi:hypothetical protein